MQNVIRDYRPDDCSQLAELFYDTVHTVNAKDYTKEQRMVWATGTVDLEEWNRSFLEHTTLVAEYDGKIVGFADMDGQGYLDRLYVHKEFQHRGIATTLVKELEQRARKDKVSSFTTYASITARPFFEKRGYRVLCENEVVRNGISLLNYRMEKRGEKV